VDVRDRLVSRSLFRLMALGSPRHAMPWAHT
jgi:hypothetical protein